jgi:hypothetical protein
MNALRTFEQRTLEAIDIYLRDPHMPPPPPPPPPLPPPPRTT